jgi:hypothetical protein
MKFYPADWRAEPRLRNCSLLARGLWMEMLALMHESESYGHLLINGKPPTDRQLAVQAGATIDEVTSAIGELETEGVFSRDRNGAIYSRRMIRDEKKAEHARKIGRKGGNPTLAKQTENSSQDNQADKQTVNGGDKAHMPEARVQKEEVRTPKPPSLPADVRSIMEEGGFISPPPDLALLKDWYAAGATLEQDIIPTVRAVRARLSKAPFKFKVFDAAIREKLAEDAAAIEHLNKVARRNAVVGSGA